VSRHRHTTDPLLTMLWGIMVLCYVGITACRSTLPPKHLGSTTGLRSGSWWLAFLALRSFTFTAKRSAVVLLRTAVCPLRPSAL
jgi:hypothetical protein